MLERIIAILFPLFAITALGFVVGRRLQPDLSHANKLNMDVFTPALVFSAMASKDFHLLSFGPLLLAAALLIMGSGVVAWGAARLTGTAPHTLVPPMMFNNSGNLGLPLAVLAFGEAALSPAVAMFVVANLLHYGFGTWLLDRHARLVTVWRTPTILAAVAGIAVSISGISVWPPFLTAIRMVGDIAVPLMLLSLGVRLAASRIEAVRFGLFGAVLRPVSGMLIAWALIAVIPLPPMQQALLLVFGSLPPAVLNYMFADRYGHEPDKVASVVLIGNLMALVSLPVALSIALR